MALVYRPGSIVTIPVVAWDPAPTSGRDFVPNGTGPSNFPGSYDAPGYGTFSNIDGYQWYQQGAFAHDRNGNPFPFNPQYYDMFYNGITYTEFFAYGDGMHLGGGNVLSLAADGLTMTVQLPDDPTVFLSYPTGGSLTYWQRYSIGLRLHDSSMPPPHNAIYWWSDFFDLSTSISPSTSGNVPIAPYAFGSQVL
jgi:hypothetical protein